MSTIGASSKGTFDVLLERQLAGFHFLKLHAAGDVSMPLHVHNSPRITLILQGESAEVDESKRGAECGPLSLIYTPANMRHAHIVKSPTITTLCASIEPQLFTQFGLEEITRPMFIRRGPAISTMLRIQTELQQDDAASGVILQGLFLQLFGEMNRRQVRKRPVEPPAWLPRACSLLRERCLENISIEEISKEIGVHPCHLARVFRLHLHQSPGEYLRSKRIEFAARELATTRRPVAEIAADTGFSDQAHFARLVKKQLGVTPTQLRKDVSR